MRRVKRRYTRPRPAWPLPTYVLPASWRPPAPWTFKGERDEGAPRVCRSICIDPVEMPGREGPVEVGVIDRVLHMYSHWGLTPHSVLTKIDDVWHVIYDIETEWEVVLAYGFWIEFVNDTQEWVARISRDDAEEHGHEITQGTRPKWAVPLNHYEIHRRNA